MRAFKALPVMMAVLLALATPVWAQQQADTVESRLREALHRSTEQLRDAQDQIARLQAKQAEDSRQVQTLTAQLAGLNDQIASGQKSAETARQAADEAEHRMKQQFSEAQGVVEKWQAAYNQAAETARSRDEAARKSQALSAQQAERMKLCEAKNGELFKLGIEVLDRYENKGVFETLSSAEPFTQMKRVEFENIVQDYEDKLRAQQIVSSQEAPKN